MEKWVYRLSFALIGICLYFFNDITDVVSYMDTLIKKRKHNNKLKNVENFDNLKSSYKI